LAISQIILNEHKKFDPGYMAGKKTEGVVKSWAWDIDKINRLDKRDWPTIEKVMRWCMANDFWRGNIFSGRKFREKFNTLLSQSLAPHKSNNSKIGLGGSDQNKDYSVPEEYQGGKW